MNKSAPVWIVGVLAFQLLSSAALAPVTRGGFRETAAGYAEGILRPVADGFDSWKPMSVAYRLLREDSKTPVYRRILEHGHSKFQYPPSSLFLTAAAERAASRWNLSPFAILDFLSWIAALVVAGVGSALFWRFSSRSEGNALDQERGRDLGDTSRRGRWVAAGLVAVAGVLFYPLMRGVRLGQVQTLLTALSATALWLWGSGRERGAAALLGVEALFKPHYAAALAFLLWRRRFAPAAVGALVVLAGTIAALVTFGWQAHVDYLGALSFLSQRGESFAANQSMNGLLGRIAGLSDPRHNNAEWSLHFPPFVPWVYGGTILAALVLLTFAIARRPPAEGRLSSTADLGTALLGITMASPIAWEHHYGLLFPLLALLAGAAVATPAGPDRRRLTVRCLLIWALAASNLDFTAQLASTPLNVLQSYLFGGAVIALFTLSQVAAGRAWPGRPLRAPEMAI